MNFPRQFVIISLVMAKNTSNNNSYFNIGNEIKESLTESLRTGDFSGLNDAINNSVKTVVKEATGGLFAETNEDFLKTTTGRKPYSNYEEAEAYAKMLQERRRAREEAKRQRRDQERMRQEERRTEVSLRKENLPVPFNPVGKTSGTACIIGGAAGAIVFGAQTIKVGLGLLFGSAVLTSLVFPGVLFAASLGVLRYGFAQKGMLDRARKYARLAGEKMYVGVSSLAASLGFNVGRVQKDIKKMLRKGYFPEGYLDEQGTTLMLSNDVYKQYEQTMKNAAYEKDEELEAAVSEDEALKKALTRLEPSLHEEFTSMVTYGRQAIRRLHKLNDDIPGENISKKLDSLEIILREIFDSLLDHPEQMNRMQKLMDYYLPTMIKLVEAYAEYDRVSNPGDDIIEAKKQIENTLDTINEAFVVLHNNLFRDSVWDVTTDAEVLQTVLKQDLS